MIYHYIEIRRKSANNKIFFFKSYLYAAFCSFFGKFHFHVRSHYGVVVYLPRGIFKAIKFPNVNQFRSIFTVSSLFCKQDLLFTFLIPARSSSSSSNTKETATSLFIANFSRLLWGWRTVKNRRLFGKY